MPLYQFECKGCKGYFEIWATMEKCPKRKRCPSCGKQVPKSISFPSTLKISNQPVKKLTQDGYDNLLKGIVDETKDLQKDYNPPYSKYDMDIEFHRKNGARILTPAELSRKVEIARRQTVEAHALLKKKK